jgi:hypothetical protein
VSFRGERKKGKITHREREREREREGWWREERLLANID